jgi:hypothetical protein
MKSVFACGYGRGDTIGFTTLLVTCRSHEHNFIVAIVKVTHSKLCVSEGPGEKKGRKEKSRRACGNVCATDVSDSVVGRRECHVYYA